jgi:N-acetylglutamate synthase-like GNAT family acetyltransferase
MAVTQRELNVLRLVPQISGLERAVQDGPIDEHIISTQPQHLDQVAELFRYSNKGIEPQRIYDWTLKSLNCSLEENLDLHRIYQHEGEIYGAISCVLSEDGKGKYVLIDDVVATPDESSKTKAKAAGIYQIGTKLIQSIEQRCTEMGIPRICLYVNVTNTKAVECYQKEGFKVHGKVVSIDNDPDYVPGVPMYYMVKELKK